MLHNMIGLLCKFKTKENNANDVETKKEGYYEFNVEI